MAAHRYWRIRGLRNKNAGQYSGLSGVEMYDTVGGANVCSGGTPISGGTIQAGSVAAVFAYVAGSTIIQFGGFQDPNCWVGYDFGAGNDIDILQIGIYPNKDDADRSWTDFVVEWSDDGSTWENGWVSFYLGFVAAVQKKFACPSGTAFRYWRLRKVLPETTMSCAELSMKDTPGGTNLCTGGTPSARTTFGGAVAALAFDGNPATVWSGNGDIGGAGWLQYDFGAGNDYEIIQITFTARNDGFFTQSPDTGYLEGSPDGENYLFGWLFLTTWTSAGQVQTFDKPTVSGGIDVAQFASVEAVLPDPGPIGVAQYAAIQAALADPVPARIAQFVMISIISGNRRVVTLRNAMGLPCWQPCGSYAFDGRIIYV